MIEVIANENEFFEYYSTHGRANYTAGENARLKFLTESANPFSNDQFGFDIWLEGWKDRDIIIKQDASIAIHNEFTDYCNDLL
tara:strand:+ start:309 stop:557 length:249 start_codon:yes stop_codon:yes gene_type:complete